MHTRCLECGLPSDIWLSDLLEGAKRTLLPVKVVEPVPRPAAGIGKGEESPHVYSGMGEATRRVVVSG